MENRSWFVHVEWVVVLVTLIGGFYTLDAKIERAHERMDRNMERSDARWESLLTKYTELKCDNNKP